jgi:hypothetical protein
MKIETVKWTGTVLRANYGGGYGDIAVIDNAAGLHMWTLKNATLPGSSSIAPIDAKSRLDYYLDFFREHTTGATEVFILEWRGESYHASFADPDMDVTQVAFGLMDSEMYSGSGLKIKQRRVSGAIYETDGSVDTTPPSIPTGLTAVGLTTTSIRLTWEPATDPDFDVDGGSGSDSLTSTLDGGDADG